MSRYKSARQLMQDMNEGIIPRQHLGPKNYQILKQELFSLKNEYTPETFTDKELINWNNNLAARIEEIEQLSETEQEQLFRKVDEMLNPIS